MQIRNHPKFKERRRYLRKDQSTAEGILWSHLRDRRLAGYRFVRQYSIGNYILDFYCPKAKLAIEVDGSHHAEKGVREYDKIRTWHLESHGIKVIRFWNSEVKQNINSVLETIYFNLENLM